MLQFLAGLPRSGSTLLCNILAQHPDLNVTPTSPLVNIVGTTRDNWRQWHRAVPEQGSDERLFTTLRGLLEGYHATPTIDKNRGWVANIETVEMALAKPMRLIVTVRELEDVVASFELMWRQNIAAGRVPAQLRGAPEMRSVDGRVKTWLREGDVIGGPLADLVDADRRGLRDRMTVVKYRDLAENPGPTVAQVSKAIGLSFFNFDFNNVAQATHEDDEVHGYTNLHTIRPKVTANPSRAIEVLGEGLVHELRKYKGWWDDC